MDREETRAVFERTPLNRTLGMRLVDREPGRAEVELPVDGRFVQEEGVVHGGVLATLADTAAVYAVRPDLPPERGITRAGGLSSAKPSGRCVRAWREVTDRRDPWQCSSTGAA